VNIKINVRIVALAFTLALAVALSAGCRRPRTELPPAPAPEPVPARLHRAFSLARIHARGNALVIDPWRLSTEIAPKRKIRVAVVASWCGASQNYIRTLSRYDKANSPVDLIVFYEDEAERMLDILEADGKVTPEQRAEVAMRFDGRDQRLVNPSAAGDEAGLDFYLISAGEFRNLITAYPSLVSCDPDGCTLER
jgi:hypothetical protein